MLPQHYAIVEGFDVQRNAPVLETYSDEEPGENRDHGVFGSWSDFLDPRYFLLDKLTHVASKQPT